mgnify:FL=1
MLIGIFSCAVDCVLYDFIMKKNVLSLCLLPLLQGCAVLHHYQQGEVDSTQGQLIAVEAKVSEFGLNLSQATTIAGALSKDKTFARNMRSVSQIWQLITWGKKTGNVSFSDDYADTSVTELLKSCPTGNLTGLVSIREMAQYPVISGEIIRVRAYCIHPLAMK